MNYNFFEWITDNTLRNKITQCIIKSKDKRSITQTEVSNILGISLTKIKEIEKGVCKDFNAINNYINFFSEPLI